VNSLKRTGFAPKVIFQTSAPSNGDKYIKDVGGASAGNGVFYAVSWSPDTNYPLNQEFVQQYQAKFSGLPEEDAADAFATAQVLQAAVEAVGSLDQDRISKWLHDNKVQTILGPLSWDETGAPQQAFILAQWQDAQSRIVLPREVANTDTIIFPKNGW
jgi:branched-chain amino acid transport system substrate-binding protein